MKKERIEYDSPVDAIVTLTKRLTVYEDRYKISSEDFFDRYSKGNMEDSIDFVEWANDYRHFMSIRFGIEKELQHVG